ncbi:hypothetical protein IM40_11045 (plasmid) [Candidatus Paracaedimonas acanthamoebae]|nr:hypothetical protein IM40_11045 [Candidatus Paracaedimonas acanthamoebae]
MSYTSRSGGGSACSHAAYISGSIVKDERTGMTWDYSKKTHNVLYSEILAPENSPEWVYDPNSLWNEVERFEDYIAEKRFKGHKDLEKNEKSLRGKEKFLSSCKTSFKADFALPLEITDKDHLRELARKIVKECYVSNGLVAQYAIHDMKGNPHLHIIATTRPLIEGSFSEKRFVIEREKLVEMRKQMADICNQYAQEKGYDYHLDHRSYKDQGIKLIATKHLGPNARHRLQELSQNVQDNEEIRQKNIEILLNHPEEIIKVVASQKAVFTQVDLAKEIFKRVGGDDKLYTVLKAKVDGIEIPSIAIIGKTLNDNSIYESKSIQFKKDDYARTIDSFTAKILSQNHAIYLGENIKGQAFYTSHEMKELETSIAKTVDLLKQKSSSHIAEKYKFTAIDKIQKEQEIIFTEEQLGAIDHLLSKTAINVLTGKAGTGKSTVLQPVVEAYKKSGFNVIGTAFQGKVADQLANELNVEGYTLDQLNNRWNAQDKLKTIIDKKELKGQALAKAKMEVERLQEWRLTDKHVVILDEGSMVHGSLWKSLLQEVERSGAQLRIVQDNKQIKALYGLDAARLIEEKVGAYEIKGVVRQKEQWMREASALLNEHRIEEGLKPYYERGHFDFRERDFESKISLVADYLEGIEQAPHQTHMALAQKNKDVVELNELLRGALKSQGKLGEEFIFGREGEGILNPQQSILKPKTQHFRKSAYGRRFTVGDRVMFLENDHKERHIKTLENGKREGEGVKNGTLGIIESFDLKRQTVEVRLHDGRLVGFDSKSYDSLTHGYAVTINKSQGATFDHSYGFFSSFNSNQLLIWLTRHKDNFKGYVSKEIASDLKSMVSHVSRSDYKGLSTDYDLAEHQKPYFNVVQHYWEISRDAGNLRTKIDALTLQADQEGKEISLTKEWGQYNKLVQTRNKDAKEILRNWVQCSSFMHQTGVRRETLEVQAGLRKKLLSAVEEAALDKVETYFNISHQARNLWKEISKTHPGSLSHHHPEYETYAKIKDARNELAYEISSFPMLYKPFFKVKAHEGAYETYQGTVYEQRPQGFKAAQEQAKQYILQKQSERYESQLTFDERFIYKQIQGYQSSHYQSVAAFKHLKELEKTAVKSSLIEVYQQKAKENAKSRDLLAFQIIENYSDAQPLIERLGLKEEILLKHAVFGEVRGMISSYKEAKVIEERTQLADKLVSFTLGERGSVDKGLYNLIKEQNLDLQKLKFEQGWLKAHQEGKELSLKTIEDLENTYRDNKKVSLEWDILKKERNSDDSTFSNKVERQRKDYSVNEGLKSRVINTYDKEEVLARLSNSQIESIYARHIEHWITNPKPSYDASKIRYGERGDFIIYSNTRTWYNHGSNEGGDIFNYVSKAQNISYGEAIKQIGQEINAPHLTQVNWEERNKRQNAFKQQAEYDEKIKIEKSQEETKKLYDSSKSIEGTLAERYLREHRKIKTTELPEDLKFIPDYKDYDKGKAHPVLVSFSRDHNEQLTAHQLIYLDPISANKADVAVKKKSKGTIKGTIVEIQKGEGITYVAEGIETALSLKEVHINGRILVSLGLSNMNNISAHLKEGEPVILCGDADNPTSAAWKTSERALEKLKQEGFKVSIIRPQGEKGRDFNDVLKEEGIKAVQEAFKNVAVFQEDSYKQTLEVRSLEKQIVCPRDGRTTENNTQNKDIAKQNFNALDHYLACEEKLKKLSSFIAAKGEEKAIVKELLKESRTHAYAIWQDSELKAKAQELGIEKIIKQRAEFHKQEMSQSINQKSSFKFNI